jgi:hypothetical protein
MFLWVRLVAHELKYCYSDAALKATVTSLPKGLKAAYELLSKAAINKIDMLTGTDVLSIESCLRKMPQLQKLCLFESWGGWRAPTEY